MRPYSKLTIKKIDVPEKNELEEQIRWFAECFDLDNEIFKELFEKGKNGLRTSNIASKTSRSKSTVLYKLNKLMDTGIVVKKGTMYYLRSNSFERSIEEVEEDVERMFKRMKEIAKNIDEQKGREIKIN